jgi:phosphatidylinositol glycan class V
MLLVLTYSAATTFYVNPPYIDAILASIRTPPSSTVPQDTPPITFPTKAVLRRLALPQIVLAVLAFTSFHVQVVNRLSSGYVLWYLYIARSVLQGDRYAVWAVRLMIMYAMVQASLFAAFLPPA